jgi:hypothetical protein
MGPSKRGMTACAFLLLVLATACSGGAAGSGGAGGGVGAGAGGSGGSGGQVGTMNLRGPCGIEAQVGRFSVEAQTDFGVVQGAVFEGVVPTSIPRLASQQGPCKVWERRNLTCTPACTGATTCGESGSCIPYPRQRSVGNVTITGLTRPTAMEPRMPGNNYFDPDADNPPFLVGSPIELTAEGAEGHRGFQLSGRGSAPLGSTKPAWLIEPGKDLKIEWAKSAADQGARVAVDLSIDQHGLSPLSLACEFEDTGMATIPATIVDRLFASGVSGFPNGGIFRRTADHVDVEQGCVELFVGSPLAAAVSVAGHTACKTPADCPSGKTCNLTLERCEDAGERAVPSPVSRSGPP